MDFDGHQRVLFVHAHPDDETLSTGIAIARLAPSGRAGVLTATRGERGEVVPGPLKPLEGSAALAAHRERELAEALHALGHPWHAWLGEPPARAAGLPPRRYQDSGMRWAAPGLAAAAGDAAPDAFSLAPFEEVVGDVLAAIGAFDASLVVSYDAGGGYGHPDHVRAHEAARAAAGRAGLPFWERAEDGDRIVADDGIAAQLRQALAAHASQLTLDGTELVLSGGQRRPIPRREGYRARRGAESLN